MRQGGLILEVGRVRSKKQKIAKKQNRKKIRPTQNTPRKPQQPGDRDHLEKARDETRPTRSPVLARFHRSRVCGNRPRTALAISASREVNEARRPHTCSRPCAFKETKNRKKKNHKKIRPTQDIPRNPQQPGDRVQLETACEETRHTR